jgi:hypothetical protein
MTAYTYLGAGPPPAGLGTVGDTFFDEAADIVYGPKTLDGWGTTGLPTDGSDALVVIQARIDALDGNGTLELPAGTFTLDNAAATALLLPRDATGLRIRGAGAGATVLKLTTATPRAFDCDRVADHDVFSNITIEDLTVDCDSVPSLGHTHVLFGNKPRGGTSNRLNFEDITIRRCTIVNVPTDFTNAVVRYGIAISPCQSNPGEATQNYAKRILVEDVDVDGGNAGVNVIGARFGADSAGYNIYLDDIVIQRCRHVQPAIVGRGNIASADATVWGASFHVGQNASVGHVTIRDCYSYGIGDVAYELNNCHTGLVENCHAEEAAGYAFYHTNYEWPDVEAAKAGTPNAVATPGQHLVFRGCSYTRRESYAFGSAFRANYNHGVPLGRVSYQKCKYERDVIEETTWKVTTGEALGVGSGTIMKELFVDGFEVHVANINHTDPADAQIVAFIYLAALSGDTFDVPITLRDITISLSGDCAAAGGRIQMHSIRVLGAGPQQLSVDGVSYKNLVTNLLSGDAHGIDMVTGGTVIGGGVIRRFRTVRDNTNNGHQIEVGTLANVTITSKVIIEDCDVRNRSGGSGVSVGTTNSAKVRIEPTVQDGTSTAIASAAAITVPIAGELFTVTGTADITSIAATAGAWAGRRVTLVFTGAAAATGLTDGNNLKLAGNFAYTADDSITLMCDGTNWFETSRAVN